MVSKNSLKRVTVLGAGYMGSAITFPISENGISVSLWGTWLDDEIIDSAFKGINPKLKKRLDETVTLFHSGELKEALEDSEALIIGVSSEGFKKVFDTVIEKIDKPLPIFTLTKGFIKDSKGVVRISNYAFKRFKAKFGIDPVWGSVGGPVKALELSDRIPTATIVGINSNPGAAIFINFETPYYRISTTDDVIGVELSSALKNIYAIAIGMCDGIYSRDKSDERSNNYHNFRSMIFSQAVEEMAYIVEVSGGRRNTVYGLAGTGDLHVTSSSGRNRLYGEYIGRGERPSTIFKKMLEDDLLAEGYNTLMHIKDYLLSIRIDNFSKTPLLGTLYKVIFEDDNYSGQLEILSKKLNIGVIE